MRPLLLQEVMPDALPHLPPRDPGFLAFLMVACLLTLAGGVSGCTAIHAYQKCGSQGCPGDAQITAEVEALLKAHPALGPPNLIYVHTVDGIVYLTGQVATGLQRDTAEAIARTAPQARKVVSTIALPYEGR